LVLFTAFSAWLPHTAVHGTSYWFDLCRTRDHYIAGLYTRYATRYTRTLASALFSFFSLRCRTTAPSRFIHALDLHARGSPLLPVTPVYRTTAGLHWRLRRTTARALLVPARFHAAHILFPSLRIWFVPYWTVRFLHGPILRHAPRLVRLVLPPFYTRTCTACCCHCGPDLSFVPLRFTRLRFYAAGPRFTKVCRFCLTLHGCTRDLYRTVCTFIRISHTTRSSVRTVARLLVSRHFLCARWFGSS